MVDASLWLMSALGAVVAVFFILESQRVHGRLLSKQKIQVERIRLRAAIELVRRELGQGVATTRLVDTVVSQGIEDRLQSTVLRQTIDRLQTAERWIDRALSLLASLNENEVLAGCDTVRAFGDRSMLPVLVDLAHAWREKPRVAQYVQGTMRELEKLPWANNETNNPQTEHPKATSLNN